MHSVSSAYAAHPSHPVKNARLPEPRTSTYLVNERARLGVGPGRRGGPERAAEVDGAEFAGVDIGEGAVRARAVVTEARKVIRADLGEVVEHGGVARGGVVAEPRRVAGRGGGVGGEVVLCPQRVVLRCRGGRVQRGLLSGRAVVEGCALDDSASALDSSRDRELAGGDSGGEGLDVRVELQDLVVGIHNLEEAGRRNGVRAVPGASEVVRR